MRGYSYAEGRFEVNAIIKLFSIIQQLPGLGLELWNVPLLNRCRLLRTIRVLSHFVKLIIYCYIINMPSHYSFAIINTLYLDKHRILVKL